MINGFLVTAALFVFQGANDPPKTLDFLDSELGLAFSYPATWKVVKKTKIRTNFEIPGTSSSAPSELEINHADYSGNAETWQLIHKTSNEQLKRTLDRQWEQEVLGVPMLLSRVHYTDKGQSLSSINALLFSQTKKKLQFILTGPTSDFDNLQYQFTNALQTLRTVETKKKVSAVAASTKSEKSEKIDKTAPEVSVKHELIDPVKPKIWVKELQTAPFAVESKKFNLHYAEDWIAKGQIDGTLALTNPDLPGSITLKFYPESDSDSPANLLLAASAQSLQEFDTVTKRLDQDPTVNRANCLVSSTCRIGKSKAGDCYTYEAFGQEEGAFFILNFKSTDPSTEKTGFKLIQKLLQTISFEKAP